MLEDRPLEGASIFPLFDGEGRTRIVMIAAEGDGRILLVDWVPGLFARGWVRPHRLRSRFADLTDASTWDEERFLDLWHFDPWWVLGEERYQGHGSVPALRRTNIPGYDSTVSGVMFDPDLGRASNVMSGSGASVRVRGFTPETLAAIAGRRRAAQEQPRAVATAVWQLRPFWRSM